jgi:hypothetical protein
VKEFNLPIRGTGCINVGDNPRFIRRNSRKFNRESILILEDNTAIQLRTLLGQPYQKIPSSSPASR